MAKSGVLDQFCQAAILAVAGVVANSGQVVTQLVTGITNNQKVGWEIYRSEFWIPYSWLDSVNMTNSPNVINLMASQSSNVAQLANPLNAALLDYVLIGGRDQVSAVGTTEWHTMPILHDFGVNPILALPQNLYAVLTWTLAAALTVEQAFIKLWYKERELGPEDWYDLLQLRLPLGANP